MFGDGQNPAHVRPRNSLPMPARRGLMHHDKTAAPLAIYVKPTNNLARRFCRGLIPFFMKSGITTTGQEKILPQAARFSAAQSTRLKPQQKGAADLPRNYGIKGGHFWGKRRGIMGRRVGFYGESAAKVPRKG